MSQSPVLLKNRWNDCSDRRLFEAERSAKLSGSRKTMKQIVTIVRPHLAEEVLTSLRRAPIEAMSVTEVKGYGRQKSYLDEYQETEYSQAFVPKVEITLWVDDSRCEEVLEKIVAVARCGRIGDGKILVLPVSEFQ
ncbi:MAG: P-II family nitrogen regulator [Rubripirellula sp.]|jgi:nitrogen regulatory protein P-II 1|nr:P-II family nitrogen regulator [Rubripirellula sp.]